jgi:hypothetical protein
MDFIDIEKILITKLLSYPSVVFTLTMIIGFVIFVLDLALKGACIYLGLWVMAKILT